MGARAIYKATLRIGEQSVPVKLYSALERRKVHFRLLHAGDLSPVKQEMFDEETGEAVPYSEVRRGFEVEDGVYAVLTDEDLASIEPTPTRDVQLCRFVPQTRLDDRWYDRAYWLGPDTDAPAYFALVRALQADGLEGVARWVMRKHTYQGALRVLGDHLVLIVLRHPEEVVPLEAVPAPEGREPDERELKLARSLVDALAGEFDPADFPVTYDDRVRELVQAKAEGRVVPLEAHKPAPPAEASLEDALAQSLRAVRG